MNELPSNVVPIFLVTNPTFMRGYLVRREILDTPTLFYYQVYHKIWTIFKKIYMYTCTPYSCMELFPTTHQNTHLL